MRKKGIKVLSIIGSLVLIAAVGFCVVWTCTNFTRVQEIMSGTNIYNKQDLDGAYRDGYDAGTREEVGYQVTINELRDIIDKQNSKNDKLTADNKKLQSNIDYYKDYIANLETDQIAVVTLEADGVLYDLCTAEKGATLASALSVLEEPVKEGYDFIGWADGLNIVDTSTTITGNMTLTAIFEIKTFSVQFVATKAELYGDDTMDGEVILYDNADAPYGYNFSQTEIDQIVATIKTYNPKWAISWKNSATGEIVNLKEYQIKADTVFIPGIITEHVDDTTGSPILPSDPEKMH